MATRFMSKALSTAALGIALSLLPAETTAASPAWSNTAGAMQLDPPAAPSNCMKQIRTYRDRRKGDYTYTIASWRDNSSNEDGFTIEAWWRNQSGVWVLAWSVNQPADSTRFVFGGRYGANYKFRVKAFNAAGESAWSNWTH